MIDIGFKWSHAREYECVEVDGVKVIRQKGTKREKPKEPLMIAGAAKKPLYAQFGELDGSEESCVKFASYWGLLWNESPAAAEALADWRREIRNMKRMMNVLRVDDDEPGGIMRMGPAQGGLEIRPAGEARLRTSWHGRVVRS